ncbi:MAG: transposase [SAR324 cluster bacterium]|nr:transposase [SAR324 cluster bacterium]
MAYNFLPYDQDQLYLMPPDLSEWVAESSLARFVSEVVEQLEAEGELEIFYSPYRADGWGRAAYHPRMMVKVILYGYCCGVTSSRRIARALENDIAFRFLSANQQPDFRTVSDFRKDHLAALEALFIDVLRLCQSAGLAKMGRVALDGRKVAGNAALDQNRAKDAIEKEVARILAEAERVDAEEDEKYGPDRRGDELPEELRTREGRLKRLKEARARLEAEARQARQRQEQKIEARRQDEEESGRKKRGRKPKSAEDAVNTEAKANITDPQSRIMKTRRGWLQGYNGQAMADCDSQVIVAQDVTQAENDVNQLAPMLEVCEAQAGRRPEEALADAGYWSEENAGLENETTELFIATIKDWKQRKELKEKGAPRGPIPKDATARDRMERKLLTRRGKKIYKQRGSTIEPVFGQMAMRGLNRIWLRGINGAKGEWSLWCTTHNLLKLWRSGYQPLCA